MSIPARSFPAGPDLEDIREAHRRVSTYIEQTPVLISYPLDELAGALLFFKCENQQLSGSFKIRGAANAVFSLSEAEAARGVVTHSSGNHGAALALAAQLRGIRAWVVMPDNAPSVKIRAVEAYGAEITFCAPTLAAREAAAERLLHATGATLIHPYDDDRVIAGQGTAALEFLEEIPDLDIICAPVSGGGLLSGTAIAAKSLKPEILVIGCEPANADDDASRSLASGSIEPGATSVTIADGPPRNARPAPRSRYCGNASTASLSGLRRGDRPVNAPHYRTSKNHRRTFGSRRGVPCTSPPTRRGRAENRNYSLGREFGSGCPENPLVRLARGNAIPFYRSCSESR